MAKKKPKIKVNNALDSNELRAKFPPSNITAGILFNHRHLDEIDTGLNVEVEPGYCLCFSISPHLANKGMIAMNAPGRFTNGPVKVTLLNCGRELVQIKQDDVLAQFWLEPVIDFSWEQT
jgi:dUTPase